MEDIRAIRKFNSIIFLTDFLFLRCVRELITDLAGQAMQCNAGPRIGPSLIITLVLIIGGEMGVPEALGAWGS